MTESLDVTLKRTEVFCSLQRNVEAFCHKQGSLMRGALSPVSREKQTPLFML